MKIEATEYDLTAEGSGLARPLRSSGVHLSDIIRYIDNTVMNPGKRPASESLSQAELARAGSRWEMGFIWEVLVEEVFMRRMLERLRLQKQDPLIFRNLALTPDADSEPEERIFEFKATWYSSRRGEEFEDNFWHWIMQIKAYCLAKRRLKATIFVFWVNGDYKESGPMVIRYDFEFTPQELEENWQIIENHRAKAAKAKGI